VEAELFHADRRTGGRKDGRLHRHDEANNRVSKFCERPPPPKKTATTIKFGGKDKVYIHLPTSKLNDTGTRDGEDVRGYKLQT